MAAFCCGQLILDDWLKKRALKNERAGASRTYVVCNGNEVIAYYALTVGHVAHEFSPSSVKRNMPDPIPVMLLGRLAIDQRYQGQGLGLALLRDAVLRTLNAASIAGIKALLVHALGEKAKGFYVAAGFLPSPIDPLICVLPLQGME